MVRGPRFFNGEKEMTGRVGWDILTVHTGGDAGAVKVESSLGISAGSDSTARRSSVATGTPDIGPSVAAIAVETAEVTTDALRETTAVSGDRMVEETGVGARMLAAAI